MDKVIMELIIAIREIKDILALHEEEMSRLKKTEKTEDTLDERLVRLALQGSGTQPPGTSERLENKIEELERTVKELSEKFSPGDQIEREFAEEHLNRLRKALAE